MPRTKIFYVDKHLIIEEITISPVDDKHVQGLSRNSIKFPILRKNIERYVNPMPNEHEERYFMTEKMAMNYVHNMLVHKIEEINDASDKDIVDLLYATNIELLPGEVSYVISKRVEKIKKKLK